VKRNLNPKLAVDRICSYTSWIGRDQPCWRLCEQHVRHLGKPLLIFHSLDLVLITFCSKAISYAVWQPSIARTHVTVARGIHFSSMGHSAPRSTLGENGVEKIQKRLELLPEEAIYLIERGSMFCWKETDLNLSELSGAIDVLGAPMSVQQAYSEMIGTEDLTLDKFQVRLCFPLSELPYHAS